MKRLFTFNLYSSLIAIWLLAGPGILWAQPTGCASTYTSAGTTLGGTAGLFAEYYPGTFQTQAGFSEASANTFFSATTPGQSRVDALLNFQSPTAAGYVGFAVALPPASGSAAVPTAFSARYRGSVYLAAGTYTFYLTADDGAYFFLGKEATLASPTPSNAFLKQGITPIAQTVTRQFTAPADALYDVQIIYGQTTDVSLLRLDYAGGPTNLTRRRVPQTVLCAGPSGSTYATNQAPTVNDATNSQLYANGTSAPLAPGFSGFDLDGTIASYTIMSLPAQGTLRYDSSTTSTAHYVAITAPFTLAAANLGRLQYTTPTAATGPASFQYQATDDGDAVSNAGTYSLSADAASADLATTLVAPATAPQGSLVYYTATSTNAGPAPVPDVATTITLPAGLLNVSLSNNGSYNSSTGRATWPAYYLASDTSVTRSIAFDMPGQPLSGRTASASPTFSDPNPANDGATAYTAPTQVADVSVAITGPARAVTSQSITYTVVTTNLGPSAATGVAPALQLVPNLTGVIVSNNGAYNATTGKVSWPSHATLAVGSYLGYTVRFNAPATVGAVLTGVSSATSATANGDPATANNDGSNGQSQLTTQLLSTTAATSECINPEVPDPGYVATPNSYYPGVGSASAGTSTLTLGPLLNGGSQQALRAGDLVVIMQMQGAELDADNSDAYGDGIANNELAAGNLQNSNFRAGLYEYAVVQSLSGNILTINSNLLNNYVSADASASQGQQRFQVVRVPRNSTLTLAGPVSGPRWNGRTGGVVVLDVSGTLDFNGQTIDMAGRGFRGGAGQQLTGAPGIDNTFYRHSNTLPTSANKGEGTAGTPRYVNDADNFAAYRAGVATTPFLDTQASGLLPAAVADGYPNGDRARGAPGNAGGGGTDGNPASNRENTGGGGGSNASLGGHGGNAWSSDIAVGGYGGADFTQAAASRLIMGGGGGGGTNNDGTIADVATYPANAGIPAAGTSNAAGVALGGFTSSGAAGGGIVLVRASRVTGTGTVNVNGADMAYVAQNDGSGGGGAGGSVLLLANAANGNASSAMLQNITVLANGGRGGSNTGGGAQHGPGGGGTGGLIFASSQLSSATRSEPASNGTTFGSENYGAGVGAADQGQSQTGITRADVPNQISGCSADVVTTLTTSATSAAPGSSITFTLTVQNAGPGTSLNVVPTLMLVPNLPLAAFTSLGGGTYEPTTGVVTFPATAQLLGSSTLTYAVTFAMPAQTVIGQAASTADDDLDPRTANNDGTAPEAQVRVQPIFDIAGRVFDDVNYGGGSGRPYATAETAALNSGVVPGAAGSATGSAGATVELYDAADQLVATTTSGPDGLYGFTVVSPVSGARYTVRVVNSTVHSARNAAASGVVPVQTFCVSNGTADSERVGGEAPELVDAPANSGSQLLTALGTAGTSQPQSVATVTFGSAAQIEGVDFGFNFSTIVSTRDAGQGSLRQFITNANALPNLTLAQAAASSGGPAPAAGLETSLFMIPDGQAHAGLRAGLASQLSSAGVASIELATATSGALPPLTDEGTAISGATQTQNVGNTNTAADLGTGGSVGGAAMAATPLSQVASPEVQLVGTPGQDGSEYGLTLAGNNQSVSNLAIYGFGKTAGSLTGADLYVTGDALTGTTISSNLLGVPAAGPFQDPGAGSRSPGSGIYLANFTSQAVGSLAATLSHNLISFHGGSGIESLASGSSTALLIQDNELRGNALSNAAAAGLHLGNYGGTVSGNLLVANQGTGLDLQGATGSATISGNTVSGNGLNGVATAGIRLDGAASTVVHNVLSGNAGAGILGMATTSITTLSQNSIYGNGTLGIDLLSSTDDPQHGTSPYVTRNDDGDPDAGANGLVNFPVLTQALTTSTDLVVVGYAPAGSVVELFLADPSAQAFGQGQTYVGTRTEGPGAGQDFDAGTGAYSGLINGLDQGAESNVNRFEFRLPLAQFSAALQAALAGGSAYLTATASVRSSSNQSTSEFSGNVRVQPVQPMPVVLTAFTAHTQDLDARLNWRTASEQRSAYFAAERSLDGQAFVEIGRVAAHGTTALAHDYTLLDAGIGRVAAGQLVYYRLHQVDADGTSSYSPVQTLRFATALALSVYPSPTAAAATLDLSALPLGTYQVRVLDAVGRVVHTASASGTTTLSLPANQWLPGTYLIQVSGADFSRTLRLSRE